MNFNDGKRHSFVEKSISNLVQVQVEREKLFVAFRMNAVLCIWINAYIALEKLRKKLLKTIWCTSKYAAPVLRLHYSKTMSMFYFCKSFLVSLARTKADNTVINLGIHVEVLFVVCQWFTLVKTHKYDIVQSLTCEWYSHVVFRQTLKGFSPPQTWKFAQVVCVASTIKSCACAIHSGAG